MDGWLAGPPATRSSLSCLRRLCRGPVSGTVHQTSSGSQSAGLNERHKMIYIIITLFLITLIVLRPRRKLNLKETSILFIIYLCAGLTIRAILFAFGM